MSATHTLSVLDRLYCSAIKRGDVSETVSLGEAIDYIERWIPRKVEKPGNWDEAKCPVCGESLSNHEGDGVYAHRSWLEYCPNDACHQKLDWDW